MRVDNGVLWCGGSGGLSAAENELVVEEVI